MMKKFIISSLDFVGEIGPILLFVSVLLLLKNKNNLFTYYLCGSVLNALLNLILKAIIQQPRPLHDPSVIKARLELNKSNRLLYVVPIHIFGMPSGHTQSVFYSTCFIYLALRDIKITLLFLLISVLTVFQRVNNYFHSVIQVVVGAMVGVLFGVFIYCMANNNIVGKLLMKMDDNAPI